jgi:hypothetical protein
MQLGLRDRVPAALLENADDEVGSPFLRTSELLEMEGDVVAALLVGDRSTEPRLPAHIPVESAHIRPGKWLCHENGRRRPWAPSASQHPRLGTLALASRAAPQQPPAGA